MACVTSWALPSWRILGILAEGGSKKAMKKLIAFITFESPWFAAGGVAAVMGQLPRATESAAGLATVVITPFHVSEIDKNKIPALEKQEIYSFELPYDQGSVLIRVYYANSGCAWYFLKAETAPSEGPLFAGSRHPYDLPQTVLRRDSLLFGAATVHALRAIAKHQGTDPEAVEWNMIAQDWEAATALLAFQSQKDCHGRLHLTLHNSYDEFATVSEFLRAGIDPARSPGDTILHRALSVVEQPAFTVSDQFASDFTDDLLQREVMAPQLQTLLNRNPIVGVDNGPFQALAVKADHLVAAANGEFGPLRGWKADNRHDALKALDAHTPTEKEPVWGDKAKFRRDESPWFVMAGRDDPRQKGYDVAVAGIEGYLLGHHGKSGCAQFLFFPIPGDEDLAGLEFLKALALRFPEDILVFPFRWVAGYTAALRAAAYALMPSLYEPFGMANEFYLAGGCVGVGRATGGNLEQIVPLHASSAYSRAVRVRAERYHPLASQPTGILFRERDEIVSAWRDWGGINDAQYDKAGGAPSRVEQRRNYAVFLEMANEMRIAIEDGIRIYRNDSELYYRMLISGIGHIQRTFSWQRAGQEYARKIG
jgi:glycogen synthase